MNQQPTIMSDLAAAKQALEESREIVEQMSKQLGNGEVRHENGEQRRRNIIYDAAKVTTKAATGLLKEAATVLVNGPSSGKYVNKGKGKKYRAWVDHGLRCPVCHKSRLCRVS